MIKIKKFIFTLLVALSIFTTTAYAEPKTKILKEGIYKQETFKSINADFRNISSTTMTIIVLVPGEYLRLYTDLRTNAVTSTKLIGKDDVIIVIGNGEVVFEYDTLE